MSHGEIWMITNESVQAGKRAGIITDMDEGMVAVLLQLAERLDHEDWPVIDGRLDNVTQSYYLKACDALGLTPAGRKVLDSKREADGHGKLAALRNAQQPKPARAGKRTG